jgi:hypothetical protein
MVLPAWLDKDMYRRKIVPRRTSLGSLSWSFVPTFLLDPPFRICLQMCAQLHLLNHFFFYLRPLQHLVTSTPNLQGLNIQNSPSSSVIFYQTFSPNCLPPTPVLPSSLRGRFPRQQVHAPIYASNSHATIFECYSRKCLLNCPCSVSLEDRPPSVLKPRLRFPSAQLQL